MSSGRKKVLLIRLDKIGDLICTLCVDQIPAMRDYDTHWAIAKGLRFVPEHSLPRRVFTEFSKDKSSLHAFLEFLDREKPDIAVSFQAPWWINYGLWKAGVPVRAGVRSQWHSYLFLNKGLRQKRSEALKHESDYNRELLEYALGAAASATPVLQMTAPQSPGLLQEHNLVPQHYVIVHPGMAGSALNWPVTNYIAAIEKIILTDMVVLTGTSADEPWLKDIKNRFNQNPRVLCLQGKLRADELLTVLEKAKWVLVPSTGVAHIAASLGTPVRGIYSPLRVQHPRRWAARGKNVKIFMPSENSSNNPDCMSEISVDQVLES